MSISLDRPLNVITLCSGYDSQCMALDRIKETHPGFDYNLVAWCEIDKYAIKSHNAVYPQWADRNLGDMTKVDWSQINERIDLLTYSTPCTDISSAGQQKGLEEDSGTRSSVLWYTRNAILQLKPKYLLMENVKALTQQKFMPYFQKWIDELESYGYYCRWQVLNAKDYEIPQNRERVFMVSIRKDENDPNPYYEFPEKVKLNKCLADVLEKDIDDGFYLSDERINALMENTDKEKLAGRGFKLVSK